MKTRIKYLSNSLFKYPFVISALVLSILSVIYSDFPHVFLPVIIVISAGIIFIRNNLPKALLSIVIVLFCLRVALMLSIKAEDNHISKLLNNKVIGVFVVNSASASKDFSQNVYLDVRKLELGSKVFTDVSGKILVKTNFIDILKKGDVIRLSGDLIAPKSFNDFDYAKYLEIYDVFAILENPKEYKYLGSDLNPLQSLLNGFSESARNVINKNLPEPHAALMLGIVFGSKEEFTDSFAQALKNTSTTHIIAVSGYNVTIIAITLFSLAGIFPRKFVLLGSISLIWVYLLIVGLDNVPALRAGMMGTFTVLGYLLGRKGSAMSSLAIAVCFLILQNPLVIKSISFQLTTFATLGLLLASKPLKVLLGKLPIIKNFAEELAVSISAMLATLPVTLGNFGLFSLVAIPTNLIVAPAVPLTMALGSAVVLIPIEFLQKILLIESYLPLNFLVQVIKKASSLSFSTLLINPTISKLVGVLLISINLLIIFEFNYRQKVKIDEKILDSVDN